MQKRKPCQTVPNCARRAVSPRNSRCSTGGREVPNGVKPVTFRADRVPIVPDLALAGRNEKPVVRGQRPEIRFDDRKMMGRNMGQRNRIAGLLSSLLPAPGSRPSLSRHLRPHRGDDAFGQETGQLVFVATAAICLMSELETWASSPSAIMKSVSMSGARRRLAIIIVNSPAMSVIGRTPRTITRAPVCRTIIDRQPLKRDDFDVGQMRTLPPGPVPARSADREHGLLFDIDADGDDQSVEKPARPLDHVQMSQGDRIERSGIDGDAGERAGIVLQS